MSSTTNFMTPVNSYCFDKMWFWIILVIVLILFIVAIIITYNKDTLFAEKKEKKKVEEW